MTYLEEELIGVELESTSFAKISSVNLPTLFKKESQKSADDFIYNLSMTLPRSVFKRSSNSDLVTGVRDYDEVIALHLS